jgi:hypothetical protein
MPRRRPCKQNTRTLIVSLADVDAEQIMARMVASEARLPYGKIERGHLTLDEQATFVFGARRAFQWVDNLDIWRASSATVAQIARRVRAARRSGRPYGVVVVDYGQKLKSTQRHSNREQAVAEVADSATEMFIDEQVWASCRPVQPREPEAARRAPGDLRPPRVRAVGAQRRRRAPAVPALQVRRLGPGQHRPHHRRQEPWWNPRRGEGALRARRESVGQPHGEELPMTHERDIFDPDEMDALEILHAARVEIGRRLVAASVAQDPAEVERQRRQMRHASDATLAIQARRMGVRETQRVGLAA